MLWDFAKPTFRKSIVCSSVIEILGQDRAAQVSVAQRGCKTKFHLHQIGFRYIHMIKLNVNVTAIVFLMLIYWHYMKVTFRSIYADRLFPNLLTRASYNMCGWNWTMQNICFSALTHLNFDFFIADVRKVKETSWNQWDGMGPVRMWYVIWQ